MVIQLSLLGGFSVVDVEFKVWSLLSQWVKWFASSPSGWVSFMSFWFKSCFDSSPFEVFSDFFSFSPSPLLLFYKSLLIPWRGLDGSFSVSRRSLVFGSLCPHFCSPVSGMTTKSCYLYIFSLRMLSSRIVSRSLRLRLVSFIGLLRDALFSFSIWIAKLLT